MSGDDFLDEEIEEIESDLEQGSDEIESVEQNTSVNSQGLIRPVTNDLDEIKAVYSKFEEVKSDLLSKEDRQSISGNVFITKSGWRKIATAFNISSKIIEEKRVVEDDIVVRWMAKSSATAPNGVSATQVGMSASNESNYMEMLLDKSDAEKGTTISDVAINHDLILEEVALVDGAFRRIKQPHEVSDHDIIATAATRAKNRAISDLVGGGEVSAEELGADDFF